MSNKISNIGRVNHIAIAVPDIERASNTWEQALGAKISEPQILPEHGVKVVACAALRRVGVGFPRRDEHATRRYRWQMVV